MFKLIISILVEGNYFIDYISVSNELHEYNIRFYFVLFAIAVSIPGFSQDYIVTVLGDTVVGEVKALTFGADKKVQITEPGKKKMIYPFFKVKSFRIDNEVYQPVKGPNGYTFMKLLKNGYLSLFSFQAASQNLYDGQYLQKKDGTEFMALVNDHPLYDQEGRLIAIVGVSSKAA